jgi:hypothetical protein
MPWQFIQNGNTQFAIDWDIVRRILKTYYTALYQLNYGQVVKLSDSSWYNPFSWSLPEISNIEVDWDMVRRDAQGNIASDLVYFRGLAQSNAAEGARLLGGMIDDAASFKEEFVDWMGDVQTENMHAINKSVDDYDSQIKIAQFVRDSSNDGLMVGASLMSGGTATAFLGAGSFLKGTAKFQDTGCVGAAVMEGVGSFGFAYVKLGKKFSFDQDMALAVLQANWKMGTELAAGDSAGKVALSGGLKLTGPVVDQAFKIGPGRTIFDRIALPIVVDYGKDLGDGVFKSVTPELASKLAGKIVQKQLIEKAGKNLILGGNSSSTGNGGTTGNQPRGQNGVIGEATLTNRYLLNLGYVNMSKGVGGGW